MEFLAGTGGQSWHDALQVSATKRFSQGYQWQLSYTFGKTVDETQGQVPLDAANSSVFPQDPIEPQNDRGPADYDVRHVFTANFSWELPVGQHLSFSAGRRGTSTRTRSCCNHVGSWATPDEIC
jgi:hypothetical protein